MIKIELYGCHFEYNGVSSRIYGLIFANSTTERFTKLSGNSKAKTLFDKKHSALHIVGIDHSESAITFDAEIICEHEIGLEKNIRRQIERWLFEQSNYSKLYIDMNDDTFGDSYEVIRGEMKRMYLNCRFINPEKLEYNGGIVGYKVTVECDSRLAWQEPISETLEVDHYKSDQSTFCAIDVDTDLNDYTYPIVTIATGNVGGKIQIANYTDSSTRFTEFIGVDNNTTFKIDNSVNYVSNNNYQKMSSKNFIRLLPGRNTIVVIGNVLSVTFEWQNRRFL